VAENNFKLRGPTTSMHTMELTVPSPGVSAGDMYRVEEVVGVWVNDYATGDTGVLCYKAEKIIVPCAIVTTSVDYDAGEPVYFDVADAEVNLSASGNYLCGMVLVMPAVGAEEVEIELDGMLNLTRGT
jgi:predicted RecA/RadA family phage recombinase